MELRGESTATTVPLWAKTLLYAAGMEEADNAAAPGELSLVSGFSSQKTVNFAIWEDGLKKSLAGAMCNARFFGDFAKRIFVEFTLRGIWQTPVDEAHPTGIAHETTTPLQLKSATFTVGGNARKIGRFELDLGNDIQLRPDVASSTGLAHAYLADRAPTLQFDPEADLVANDDIFGDWIAGTTAAFQLMAGSAAGNQVQIDAPRLQYINPQEANRNQLFTHDIQCQLNADAGDDEFTLAFL